MGKNISEVSILGLSAYYHDSAAALIKGGKIIAAAQEERFSRKKHDPGFPEKALTYCLREADIRLENVDYVIFYDKPLLKFERLLETYLSYAPHGVRSFIAAMPVWLKEKLYLKTVLKKELAKTCNCSVKELPTLLFNEHHKSHAALAFYPGPFEKAAVICLDGVGEWAASSVWSGDGRQLTPVWQVDFPHSLGLLYSAFTYYTGFKVNSGEYKLMGLAPYGEPKYVKLILEHLLDLKDDGTFRLNMEYFNYPVGLTMTGPIFAELFDAPVRSPESPLTQQVMDIARSIQVVTEEIVLKMARSVHKELGVDNLCLAGGVALNCVSNGRLLREGPFKDIWIQPAAGDAGGALGAAFSVWHEYLVQEREVNRNDSMQGAYLGPAYPNEKVRDSLKTLGACYRYVDDDQLFAELAERIASGEVIGWMQGRMEFGPIALGARSIIGDPGNTKYNQK